MAGGGGSCMARGVHGEGGIHGGGRAWQVCAWQERRLLQRRVRILLECILVTGRNEVVAKVIFLHLFVILFTGGCVVLGVSGPGGGVWCGGSALGGCLIPGWGGGPLPGGCLLWGVVWSRGGGLVPAGGLVPGGVCSWGVSDMPPPIFFVVFCFFFFKFFFEIIVFDFDFLFFWGISSPLPKLTLAYGQ